MERQKWTARIFNLNLDPGWANNVLARLQDTAIRLSFHTLVMKEDQLIYKPNGAWSVKEHIGHLIDLEPLHHKRLREFLELKENLSPADMSNTATERADHNLVPLKTLLTDFSHSRNDFIDEYLKLPEASLQHNSVHPRLKVPMKPVDLLFFVAEHDDHHLASIQEIIRQPKP